MKVMEWINDIIKNNAKRIFEQFPTVQEYCFLYNYDKKLLSHKDTNELLGEEEVLAAKGFMGITPDSEELSIINKPEVKRIAHYNQDKYKLIGICLTGDDTSQAYTHLRNFVKNGKPIDVFLVQKFFTEFTDIFLGKLKTDKDNHNCTKILRYIYFNEFEDQIENIVSEISKMELETADLIVLSDLQNHFSKQSIQKTTYKNLGAKDLVIAILNNFENSVKKITDKSMRYGKSSVTPRNLITINDEYDVQDLLYVILKSIFPEIKYEDDTSNYGGSAKRLDFYLKKEGIIIEVKHIDRADDKKYTKQMKEDLQSYHVVNNLTDIIFFIYAPKAVNDINNFTEMQGIQTIQGKTFNVIVIVVQ